MTSLICIDFINEIVGVGGKLAAKGYRTFVETHGTLQRVAERQQAARDGGEVVIHVGLGFEPNYTDHPSESPILGAAPKAGILQVETMSTAFVEELKPLSGDVVMVKKRLSPFFGTPLEITLRTLGVKTIVLAGVATDLAVQSAARDAHDRDFEVLVAADSCAAASESDHENALANMAKFATLI
ncbi:MAG: cysteine hydrolase family protein [Actinomycetota bacterium]